MSLTPPKHAVETRKPVISDVKPRTIPQQDLINYVLNGQRFFDNPSQLAERSRISSAATGIETNGILFPSTRDLAVGTPSAGGYTVQTDVPKSTQAPHPVSACRALGAQIWEGLKGNVSQPVIAASATLNAITESQPGSGTTATFDVMPLSMKTVGAPLKLSKQLVVQRPDINSVVATDILRVAYALEDAYALGSISSPAPGPTNGLLQLGVNSGSNSSLRLLNYQSVTFGATPTIANFASMVAAVGQTNAANDGTWGFAINSASWNILATTLAGGSTTKFILEDNKILGLPVVVSENVSTGQAIFGRWSDLVMGHWGLEILADPYTLAINFQILLTVTLFFDVNVLRGPSFVKSTNQVP